MKTFIFLIEKLGYKFKVEANCGGEALYKLMQENPTHEVFNDCIEGSPVGFNLTVLMRGEEVKAKIREFEVTLSEKGFSSPALKIFAAIFQMNFCILFRYCHQ